MLRQLLWVGVIAKGYFVRNIGSVSKEYSVFEHAVLIQCSM